MYYFILLSHNLPTFQQQWAIGWFLPLIIIGAAVIRVMVGYFGDAEPIAGKKIAVLGMQGSGKTQFLANIRNEDYKKYEATIGTEDYEKFNIEIGNREVTIEGGKDIGGGEENIRFYYEDMIKNNEIVFFLFDAYKYLNNNEYRDETQARLEFVNRHSEKRNKEVVIFSTFADKFENKENTSKAYMKIKDSVSEKPYRQLFVDNRFFLLDMRDKNVLINQILNKIFE